MSKRVCVFCRNPNNKMSAEHVWPTWFGNIVSELDRGEMSIRQVGTQEPSRKVTSAAPLTVRRVCQPCNTGWMKDIEDAALHVLAPMIRSSGEQIDLNEADQRAVARWAVLKSMVALLATPAAAHVVPDAEYQRFYEYRRPSGGITAVWLAAYMGTKLAGRLDIKASPVIDARTQLRDDAPFEYYCVTLCLHRVIVQTFDVFSSGKLTLDDHRPGLNRIWPLQHKVVSWPWNGTAFNDHELHLLAPPTILAIQQ